jgi:hypothetical protein
MENVDLSSEIELLMKKLSDPAQIARTEEKTAFIENVILQGLHRFHGPRSDSADNRCFPGAEFQAVLERCTEHGVSVIGIEVFTPAMELVEVRIREQGKETNGWCFDLLRRYEKRKGLLFDATYQVPPEALAQ